ncbi:DNA-formamidopyrimidine glycosylase [Candidatus Gottesmanbacteria bacterium]|nr:DNA-formamidopyrimidine glycosylase [Candidatus Gottesmanbacteria bacterium]
MPELPEVETLKNQFSHLLIGQKIKSIDIKSLKSFQGGKDKVLGQVIADVNRFAKILVLSLSNNRYLAIHLKLTGQLIYRGKKQPKKLKIFETDLLQLPNIYTRVIINFQSGDKLYFNDQRKFGWVKVVDDLASLVKKLGPDPLAKLDKKKFYEIIHASRKPIKVLLMDQEKIGGVGNIYANDSLFLSKINPKVKADQLSINQAAKLFGNLVRVLTEGIKWRGSSQDNFRDAYGVKGEKQDHFYVYGKSKEKCINGCGGIITRIELGGRGTFYCPICQR